MFLVNELKINNYLNKIVILRTGIFYVLIICST